VRHRHRDRVEPDRDTELELIDDAGDRCREALPLKVGLRAGEHQKWRGLAVFREIYRQRRFFVALPVVLDEHHRRAPGPVVEKRIDVEGHQGCGVVLLQQLLAGEPGGIAGIDEAGHRLHENGAGQRGPRVLRKIIGNLI